MATARSLITGALQLAGVLGEAESLSAFQGQDGLRRLNHMVSAWRTQSLTTLSIERQIFNLTANQQQYSVGLGAEFNVPRPTSIGSAGLLLNGLTAPEAVTIARSSTTATVTLASHGFAVGQEVYIAGCTDPAYNQSQIILTVPTANTFTYQVFGSPVTPAAGSPTVQAYDGEPVEIPRAMLTGDAYTAVQLKTLSSSQFTNVYYSATQPYGTLWLWPMPNTDANQLVLYLAGQFVGFADLSTDYTYPDMPGYAEALEYNLARRLATANGVNLAEIPDVVTLARESLALVKRKNYELSDLPTDPALTMSRTGGYNINTNQGG